MKYIFEYLTDSFSLLDNPLDDWVIITIIGVIAYIIAYRSVGYLYRLDLIAGREAGHVLHWIIRLIVFVFIFGIATVVIRICHWFNGLPDYKWWVIGIVIVFLIVGKYVVNHIIYKKEK